MRVLLASLFALGLSLAATGCAMSPQPYYYQPAAGVAYVPGYGYAAPGYGYYGAPGYYGQGGYRPYYPAGQVYRPGPVVGAPTVYGAPAAAPVYARPVGPMGAPGYGYAAPRMGVPAGGGWHGGRR